MARDLGALNPKPLKGIRLAAWSRGLESTGLGKLTEPSPRSWPGQSAWCRRASTWLKLQVWSGFRALGFGGLGFEGLGL